MSNGLFYKIHDDGKAPFFVVVLFGGWDGERKLSRCLPNTRKIAVFDKTDSLPCVRQTTRQLSLAVPTSKKDNDKKCRYRTSSEPENSVLEIKHVTNVTTVINETAASDRVSR